MAKTKVAVSMKLKKGEKDGVVQTTNESIGKLSVSGYDDSKAMDVVKAAEKVLSLDVVNTVKSEQYSEAVE